MNAMPELPEVESVRRLMERVLGGQRIVKAEVPPDEIVLSGFPADEVRKAVLGRTVTGVGRKGKFWWVELDERPWLFGHLGMSGWIRELGGKETRLKEHGNAPLVDEEGKPRFLKLLLEGEGGGRIAFTDGRRLGRLWLGDNPETDRRVAQLGPDAFLELPPIAEFARVILKRKAPIKAVLLDQAVYSGIGNWIADEVLYAARIAPARIAQSLAGEEVEALHTAIRQILRFAVEVDADYERFPADWMFHVRWGGGKGAQTIGGRQIMRETVGGRTTAWVPEVQK